jgi:hypothetical protein
METIDRFAAYAAAFEEAYVSDNWSQLEPFFTEDAVYVNVAPAPFGGEYKGRTAVFTQFQNSANDFDRRFDSRKLDILEGPIEKDGAVWIRCALLYTLAGAPDCRLAAEERAIFEGDRISRLEDSMTDVETERVRAYLAQHGAKLKPMKEH